MGSNPAVLPKLIEQGQTSITLSGYAVLYGIHSVGGIDGLPANEIIERGAFADSVKSGLDLITGEPLGIVWNHRSKRIIATTKTGLRLFEDDTGIRFEIDNFRFPKRKLTGCSFEFRAVEFRRVGLVYRLVRGYLRHFTLLTDPYQPAYAETLATIKVINI